MAIAFKEWSLVCQALESGRQSLILRKGGIAEGRGGFSFKHEEFFLFPTEFHEQESAVLEGKLSDLPERTAGVIPIRLFARCEWAVNLTDWSLIDRLAPFHILKEQVIRERYEYKNSNSISVAAVRIFRLDPVWDVEDSSKFGGCKSWIDFPELPEGTRLVPVVADAEWMVRQEGWGFLREAMPDNNSSPAAVCG